MLDTFNHSPSLESKEKYTSKIDLHFFRHSIKEDGNPLEAHLSDAGRRLAKEKAPQGVNPAQAVALGSSRIRTQETAGFMMAGSGDDITGAESLKELRQKIDKQQKVGSKIGVDDTLNFTDDPNSPLGKVLFGASAKGTYFKTLVEDSDRIAKRIEDTSGATYSKKAAQIAQIIEKYITIAPRWNKLVEEKSNQYTPNLERYLSTHQGMQESFLAKLIEKTDGISARDAFVDMVGHQGFDYIEGFDVAIETGSNGRKIYVTYKTKKGEIKKEVSEELIREIISLE